MNVTMLVLTILGVVISAIAILPLLGFDIRIRGRSEISPDVLSRSWHSKGAGVWTALTLCLLSVTLSGFAAYFFFHPRFKDKTIERIVEKPVDRMVEKPCPTKQKREVTTAPNKPKQDNSVHVEKGSSIDQKSQGECSPNIVGGSNTVNCAPPPAHLNFKEEIVSPFDQTDGKFMKVHIKTDRPVPGAVVGIIFSGPVIALENPALNGAGHSQLDRATLIRDSMPVPNSIAIIINIPAAFLPTHELIVPIKSPVNVNVLNVSVVRFSTPD